MLRFEGHTRAFDPWCLSVPTWHMVSLRLRLSRSQDWIWRFVGPWGLGGQAAEVQADRNVCEETGVESSWEKSCLRTRAFTHGRPPNWNSSWEPGL